MQTGAEAAGDAGWITHICRDANYDDKCAGLVVWLHTFLTRQNVDQRSVYPQQTAAAIPYPVQRLLPWDSIDMDFMN